MSIRLPVTRSKGADPHELTDCKLHLLHRGEVVVD